MHLEIILLSVVLLLLIGQFIYSLAATKSSSIEGSIEELRSSLSHDRETIQKDLKDEMARGRQDHASHQHSLQLHLGDSLDRFSQRQSGVFDLVNSQILAMVEGNDRRFERMESSTVAALDKIKEEVALKLEAIKGDNQAQLERMRETVDEKLHKTLEERLGRSFKMVSEHLEMVQKGLGEMQHLASGVGDLKKVLSNVKTRGVLGEIQLLNIIDELLTKEQYMVNCVTVPGRNTRVEVAIKMPGQLADPASELLLPVDSKFPLDRYEYLCDAYEDGNPQTIQSTTKDLHRAILQAASDIRTKYVSPPHTTDFAIMFLPIEGLYAEISREPELLHRLRVEYQIVVAGPNNLSAFLNALQMGFRTLAIEKRSSEVWSLLSEIKSEFHTFGTALDKVQKKLTEASNVIDKAGVRKRAMERRLSKVEELPQRVAGQAPADVLLALD
ncbi:MAG: DNA recombination protein RmuC [Saprospiraceae bacterium]|nr:DNA recombination protein RmuC [Saprospiraceae bacterium]